MMIGILGDMVFNASSFRIHTINNLSRSGTARIAKHEVISSKPKLEFLGDDLDEISFTIRLDASLGVDPDLSIDYLLEARKQGAVLDFAVGQRYYGQFMIVSMDEDIQRTFANGTTLLAEISLQLQEYIE